MAPPLDMPLGKTRWLQGKKLAAERGGKGVARIRKLENSINGKVIGGISSVSFMLYSLFIL
jgi:hypothetical protein